MGFHLSLFVLFLFPSLFIQEPPPAKVDQFQLGLILRATREYCQRLEKAAIDFVCEEEASEKIDSTRDDKEPLVKRAPAFLTSDGYYTGHSAELRFDSRVGVTRENTFLCDYQFVRQAGQIKENRVLLAKDGKKTNKKEAPPKTEVFQYSDILLGPVRLFDERFRDFYEYRLLREEMFNGVKAWVIQVSPRLAVVETYLGGQVWIEQDDSSILRIEWDPTTFGSYETILLRAKKFKSKPQVTSYTEFGFEKNGIRFPSLDFTEEAYLDKDGKKFIRSQTKVVYKEYRFFTVETETEFKK
jgi:hypothetical protein